MDKTWTTRCGNSNGCITVLKAEDKVFMSTEFGELELTMQDWRQLAEGIKAGKLDYILEQGDV